MVALIIACAALLISLVGLVVVMSDCSCRNSGEQSFELLEKSK